MKNSNSSRTTESVTTPIWARDAFGKFIQQPHLSLIHTQSTKGMLILMTVNTWNTSSINSSGGSLLLAIHIGKSLRFVSLHLGRSTLSFETLAMSGRGPDEFVANFEDVGQFFVSLQETYVTCVPRIRVFEESND